MGTIPLKTRRALVRALTGNIDWSRVDELAVQQILADPQAVQTTGFINNGAKLVDGNGPWIVPIDRSTPFDAPVTAYGKLHIWRGEYHGDGLNGEPLEDARSKALTEIDMRLIELVQGSVARRGCITGWEFYQELTECGGILLDTQIMRTFLQNPDLFAALKQKPVCCPAKKIYFLGTLYRAEESGGKYICSLEERDGKPHVEYHLISEQIWSSYFAAAYEEPVQT